MKINKIVKGFVPQVFPENFGGGMPYTRALANEICKPAPRPARVDQGGDADSYRLGFEEKRVRNGVSEKQLRTNMENLQTYRRLCLIYTWGCGVASVLAGRDIYLNGIDLGPGFISLLMIILTPPLTLLSITFLFRYTFHLWQGQRRTLAGIGAFFADGGLRLMFKL